MLVADFRDKHILDTSAWNALYDDREKEIVIEATFGKTILPTCVAITEVAAIGNNTRRIDILRLRYQYHFGVAEGRTEPRVQRWIAAQRFGTLLVSVVTIGEMEKGFTTMRDLERRERLESWLERKLLGLFGNQALPVTQAIAKRWGYLDGRRQMAGRPIAVPNGLIAATALEHDLTLVTRNVRDFAGLGVAIFNPWEQ
jgi:predicted nucleic acid-binding protein